jgi:inner membrane protein
MDFVTHAAVGGMLGRALAPEGEDADVSRWTRLGALVALLPDADHVLEAVSAEAYLIHHRTFSHSLLAGLVAAGLVAAGSKQHRGRMAVVAGASFASHLFLDVLTPFGTGLGWPFSPQMAALDGLWIVAPWLLALTAIVAIVATVRGKLGRRQGRFAAIIGIGLIVGFTTVEFGVARRAAAETVGNVVLSGPSWANPLAGVAYTVEGDRLAVYRVAVDGSSQVLRQPERCDAAPSPADVEAARSLALPYVQRLRVPVAYTTSVPNQVVFEDAQFWTVDPGHPPFLVRVDLPTKTVTVTERNRGVQIVLYLLVVAFAVGLTRRSKKADAKTEEAHGDDRDR